MTDDVAEADCPECGAHIVVGLFSDGQISLKFCGVNIEMQVEYSKIVSTRNVDRFTQYGQSSEKDEDDD
jgi:predicted HTH domain antitoxin